MVIVKCTAPDVYAKNIWGSAVQSKATKNQHATTHNTHITHITHITLTPPQSDASASLSMTTSSRSRHSLIRPTTLHRIVGIIFNTRDV